MGLYYSGGYDKLFNPTVIRDLYTGVAAMPQSAEYAAYCDAHIAELVERYRPSVLWNDIAYPARSDLDRLFAAYYEAVPDGVVNERWMQVRLPRRGLRRALFAAGAKALGYAWPLLPASWRRLQVRAGPHYDFTTPEYEVYREARSTKWEAVRGLGTSFGNNREERDEDMLSPGEIVHLLVDAVSKNGNLTLGVAPELDGTFPEPQRRRLLALGAWLRVNGEAIYDTRPWRRAEGTTADGLPVRFTCTDAAVYAVVLGAPGGRRLVIEDLAPPDGAELRLLGHDAALSWARAGAGVAIDLPAGLEHEMAVVVRVDGSC
jgi:alpha-L-fucosidase